MECIETKNFDNRVEINKVSDKLQERGYQVGELDGVLGRKTKAALIQYQIDHNLPIGQLDFATIKKLGLMR